jgi:glycosyltransferase involved in cell wall biosynthesis
LKILQVCTRYYPATGGIQQHVKNISERLAKKHEVTVVATDPQKKLPKQEVINGVKVLRFNSWAPENNYFFSKQLNHYLAENSSKFDIVHVHSYHDLPALYAAKNKEKNKLVFTPHYHGTGHSFVRAALHKPYKYLAKDIFKKADAVVCVSAFEKRLLSEKFDLTQKLAVVVPNGVDPSEFANFQKNYSTKNILSISRLEKYKGTSNIISVLPQLESDVKLTVVGSGPYKKTLEHLVLKLKLNSQVTFLENLSRNELIGQYFEAAVFCLLSQHESYGITVAEALTAKTPCIVTDTSALTEWIDGKNCFGVAYPVKSDELLAALKNVMGKKVQDLSIPTWDQVVDSLIGIYSQVLT